MKIIKTVYNIITGTKSYNTPSATWRYNPRTKMITQECKKANMKKATIDYAPWHRTWNTHINRVERQARWIVRV
jgi:hypothetical protein